MNVISILNYTGAASTWVDTAPAVTKGWKAKQGERLPQDLGDLTIPGGVRLPNNERSRCWGWTGNASSAPPSLCMEESRSHHFLSWFWC